MRSVTIQKNDSGQRMDKFLTKYLKNVPQSLLYKYIRLKRVKVNGKRTEIGYKLAVGDVVDMYINDEFFAQVKEEEAFLKVKPEFGIVYEDENILIVDKKPGLIVHSDDNEQVNTLIAQIQSYLYQKGEYDPKNELSFAPALCNRIDRNTGGMVLAAKNAQALRDMNRIIKNNELKKQYLCIVTGVLPQKEGELRGYLFKDSKENRVYIRPQRQPGSKTVITRYRVLKEKGKELSLVEVDLITGRTHQIRAHFASIGHPLLGDGKYGSNRINKQYGMFQQALYSYKLRFALKEKGTCVDDLDGKCFQVKEVPFVRMFDK
jgi:23S rRNA pseudouridine955/2504/2580 synthase